MLATNMGQHSCPFCGFSRSWVVRRKKRKCKSCRREFGGKAYPVYGFRITRGVWHKVVATFLPEHTEKRVSAEATVNLDTAQKMAHRLRVVMAAERPAPFAGIVEKAFA